MVISSTNMNKKNNHLSPQANEHNEKGTTYYGIGNPLPGPGMEKAQKRGRVKTGQWQSNPLPLDNWFSNSNTDTGFRTSTKKNIVF